MTYTHEPMAGTTAERLAARGPVAVAGRAAVMATLANECFDLLIIGGGIVGAGIARDAALAGLRAALVERDDFASGTSSRSSRLIHGGVRYLEHGHLALVFESSRDRRLLLSLAPHLVRPLAFTWPVYANARVPRWKLRAGLLLYDALSLFRNVHPHQGLSKNGVSVLEPALSHKGLKGGARYWDAATDDTRLTLANAIAAREAGAVVLNHVAVVGGVRAGLSHNGRLSGVTVEDKLTRTGFSVSARVIVNATGPWSDATATLTGEPAAAATVMGSAGTHIAVPRQRLGNRDAITLVSPVDGRVMFVLPAGAHAIVGTTERPANADPDNIRATQHEISYLLHSVNQVFPYAQLTPEDVVSGWAGIRPLALQRAGHDGANSASREHAVHHREDGLVSVTGGKLTTYRAMAQDVLKHALTEFEKTGANKNGPTPQSRARLADEQTKTMPLPGGDITSLADTVHDAQAATNDAAIADRLATAYGSRWRNVWSYAQRDHSLAQRLVSDLPYCVAEVAHAVEREMACKLADVLVRRTHIAFETRDNGRGVAKRIAPLMGALLGWSAEQQAAELADYERDVTRLFAIEPT